MRHCPHRPAVGEPHQIVHASAADDRAMEEPTPLSVMLPPTTVHAPQHPVHVSVQQQLRPAASNPPTAGAAIGPPQQPAAVTAPPVTPIFVGNVPLTPTPHIVDTIAATFHNSTRRTLSFVPPTIQNGEIIVRPSLNSIRNGSQRWANTAVGYFLGRRPYFPHVKDEVCGQSGDIRGAAEEFQGCLQATGLITLPMQGERFTWHNCSRDSRSLWKRLDRLLVNDRWLTNWPSTTYASLTARTSDHSPLILRGDTTARAVGMFRFDNYLARSTEFPHQFNEYGSTVLWELLGGRPRDRFIDLRHLRPWARHILTETEAEALVLPVSPDEVKQALFDIDESKAPGPDGYSAGFFKAAWPVIGGEVTQAIRDFFQTGRLLKQVNATLISLIPKVSNPGVVAEFRPISCCNVLYKVITKILVQRMRGILDTLISPSQNAFVPGRAIGDNILLAQELFSGYNQKHLPPRCALKVDLRKAYDTVEWDFLTAVLILFGFPEQFIQWIVECVTTPSFSVCLNGAPHGFFKGARGLRQGDPMSPFLFVLVMEVLTLILLQRIEQNGGFSYHWRCDRIQLFQLGFADDLLLFRGAPPTSLFGLPLLASRLSVADCRPILQKIEARIRGWDGIVLSFAGRVQLIKSVLSALQVYWAMAFILPKHVIKEIEKRLRNFLWKGSIETGYAKVSWKQVCRPVNEGGLGIRDIHALNKSLMSRHLWRLIAQERSSIWVNWIFHYRLQHYSVWTISTRSGTWGWRKLIRLRDSLRPCITYRIGDGTSFSLWHDPWHARGALISHFPLGPQHTSLPTTAPLCMVILEESWNWPSVTNMESIDITHELPTIHGGPDRILWTGPQGSFSAAAAYTEDVMESHEHLFFMCSYATRCILAIRRVVSFHWPYSSWPTVIRWASVRWRGKHVVCASYRALLASLVYHLWRERNLRIFQHTTRTAEDIARTVVSDIRDLIICKQLPSSVSTRGLYRIWRIPWPVEGEART
ncbi:UNVERIFIED_CONTAM: Retrovirus-related Pol polyprotein from type-2 retrotransposable element R2DM [Sesamum radiatum]|uniref:Retrovirus-related Pol polyprotein from type-2 retrotransposable element R2DM n=1 Tax=Sesamum radiatum TaxID=300843 RepID=A0AAW2JER2_SESRA